MKRNIKKYYKFILVGVVLMLVGFSWWNNQWVMKINGQKISKEEYVFYQKNNALLNKQKLQNKIIEDKVQLQQAEKLGIETINDYPALQREMDKVNQANEKKIKKGQVVYGLRKYDETSLYSYSLSNMIIKLKKKTVNIEERQLKDYYQEHQTEFKTIESKELFRVSGKKAVIERLRARSTTEEELAATSGITFKKVTLDEASLRDWIKYHEKEVSNVDRLQPGAWSALFNDTKNSWSYFCVSNQECETKPFDEVKHQISLRLEKQQYQANVNKWVKQSKVESK